MEGKRGGERWEGRGGVRDGRDEGVATCWSSLPYR